MREIKFRAFENGQMRYDFWNRCDLGNYLNSVGVFSEVKIMQFTGLHDKNGKEEFVGDIIEKKSPVARGIIKLGEFDNPIGKYYGFYVERIGKIVGGKKESLLSFGKHEVIGNIYEHSNLLDNTDTKV